MIISARFLIVCVFLSALLGATVSQLMSHVRSAHAQTDRKVIRASAFEVVDDNGTLRAALGATGPGETVSGVTLALCDEHGSPRADLTVVDGGRAFLALHDREGRLTAALANSPNGASFIFWDKAGLARIHMAFSEAIGPAIMLEDANGKTIWEVP